MDTDQWERHVDPIVATARLIDPSAIAPKDPYRSDVFSTLLRDSIYVPSRPDQS